MAKKKEVVMDYWKAPQSEELMIGFFIDEGLDKAFPAEDWGKIIRHAKHLDDMGYKVLATYTIKVDMETFIAQSLAKRLGGQQ